MFVVVAMQMKLLIASLCERRVRSSYNTEKKLDHTLLRGRVSDGRTAIEGKEKSEWKRTCYQSHFDY